MKKITICNPLPEALRHFRLELAETLVRTGFQPEIAPAHGVEDRPGAAGKLIKLSNAIRNSQYGKSSFRPTIQCWPSLGLLEPLLWSSSTEPNYVIFHDPVPIRQQVGFDHWSKLLASRMSKKRGPVILVHSSDAFVEAEKLFPGLEIQKALHPVRSAVPARNALGSDVVVAGQFKPERNVELLAKLGPLLRRKGLRPRIVGRGWPAGIPGWDIDSRFLSEIELDAVIDEAAVILIPYKNYFQSGIAIRALERGRLSVSPENSFANEVFGSIPGSIYKSSATPEEVLESLVMVSSSRSAPLQALESYRERADLSWTSVLTETSHIHKITAHTPRTLGEA